ncbi:MAG TPA: TIGR04283 family arsenosugar biosynthesis glycosyltransferase [Bacillota bacterium]|nr:TIGR04283 family arsenosugar biosynthesis glycosyltransferase [Bacillota bacterium]
MNGATHTVSIVIPTLNEAECIGTCLEAIARVRGVSEVIVVDGGSGDMTLDIARTYPVRLLRAQRGRGSQLHAGANLARGEVLWFLHADVVPPADAIERILAALADQTVLGGNCQPVFDGQSPGAHFLTRLYPHLRRLGLRYGDSGIFVRREVYQAVGGFESLPIFEDLDLIRRLRRQGRFVQLPVKVVASSRRFEGRSFLLTFAHWSLLQVLYWFGVHPHTLDRLYPHVRSARAKP